MKWDAPGGELDDQVIDRSHFVQVAFGHGLPPFLTHDLGHEMGSSDLAAHPSRNGSRVGSKVPPALICPASCWRQGSDRSPLSMNVTLDGVITRRRVIREATRTCATDHMTSLSARTTWRRFELDGDLPVETTGQASSGRLQNYGGQMTLRSGVVIISQHAHVHQFET